MHTQLCRIARVTFETITASNKLRSMGPGLAGALLLLLGIASCIVINLRMRSARAQSAEQSSPAVTRSSSRKKVQTELITINPGGFFPRTITRSKEAFFLAVDNRSGAPDVTLRLSRKTGSKVHEVLVTRNQPDWVELFDLTPGDYELTDADHLAWVCQITISPN